MVASCAGLWASGGRPGPQKKMEARKQGTPAWGMGAETRKCLGIGMQALTPPSFLGVLGRRVPGDMTWLIETRRLTEGPRIPRGF